MAPGTSVHLLEVEPDLARYLSEEERADARRLKVPVTTIARGPVELGELFDRLDAFGALVLEGMLVQRLAVSGHVTMRLIGPSDALVAPGPRTPRLHGEGAFAATADTSLAVLGREMMLAVRRWPGLVGGLQVRLGEQIERGCAQIAICQLPRVSDRLLGMLWLLAESWGRVTPSGVSLPLRVTHDALGALIGARRSTVTLALGELVERGALVRQDSGWLLLEELSPAPGDMSFPEMPELAVDRPLVWRAAEPATRDGDELRAALDRMRSDLEQRRTEMQQLVAEFERRRDRLGRNRAVPRR